MTGAPGHNLPTRHGVGPSCVGLPVGPWRTITDFLVEHFPAISRETWLARMASKQVDRVIPALEQSEKDLPNDFNPPARLAAAHKELGRLPEALADVGRALQKNTGGPRRVRLLEVQASILGAKGDLAGQKPGGWL